MTTAPDDYPASNDQPTECVCPKCEMEHIKMIFWSGLLPARIYCDSCRAILSRIDGDKRHKVFLPLGDN